MLVAVSGLPLLVIKCPTFGWIRVRKEFQVVSPAEDYTFTMIKYSLRLYILERQSEDFFFFTYQLICTAEDYTFTI